jgi:hypothetical protein
MGTTRMGIITPTVTTGRTMGITTGHIIGTEGIAIITATIVTTIITGTKVT